MTETFEAILEEDQEGRWTLTVPALPGYIAFGNSEEEVLVLALEGIPFHLACLREEGDDLSESGADRGDRESPEGAR